MSVVWTTMISDRRERIRVESCCEMRYLILDASCRWGGHAKRFMLGVFLNLDSIHGWRPIKRWTKVLDIRPANPCRDCHSVTAGMSTDSNTFSSVTPTTPTTTVSLSIRNTYWLALKHPFSSWSSTRNFHLQVHILPSETTSFLPEIDVNSWYAPQCMIRRRKDN